MPATVALVNTQTPAIDYELALESASKEQATYSAVISVGALEPTQLTYVARGGAALGEAAGASASPEDPSAAFYLESNEVTLRVAPAITDDMVASAQRLCDAVQQQVDEAYPDGNPDENALQLVYDYLTSTPAPSTSPWPQAPCSTSPPTALPACTRCRHRTTPLTSAPGHGRHQRRGGGRGH